MQQSRTRSVGLDVHTDALAVASVAKAHHAAVVSLGNLGPRHGDIDTRVRQLQSKRQPLVFVSEAGPCGSGLSRSLTTKGQVGWGIAPSLLPTKPGDRVKTTRRDAITLARLMRSGDLTPVSGPQGEEEAMRALCRAREEAMRALKTAKLRRKAVLLRQAIRDTGRATWGPGRLRWRSAVVCPTPAQHIVCQADVRAVPAHTERLARLEQERPAQGQPWRLRSVVDALQALRGVQLTGAVTAGAALGDRTRFATPRPLMRSRGLPPAAYSPGDRRRQGGLTQAGHRQAHRALLEGAWASRSPATVSRPLQRRLENVPTPSQALRWQAQGRLGKRSRQLSARGQHANTGVVASARELRAVLWAMAQEVPLTP